ncbi:MAG TPA: hypothetical protein VES60_03625 [Nakamurella sp.]|nr:hypothetical protein [Nakamurella sp.]
MFILVKDGAQLVLDELVDVLLRAEINDPVYVPGRGWIAVGDLRPSMVPGWADLQPPRWVAFSLAAPNPVA